MFASFLNSLRSSYRGLTTPPPQTAAVEAPRQPRPQDDIECIGGGAAISHNQQDGSPSMEEVVFPSARRRRELQLSVSEMFASFFASLRSTFHTAPRPQTAASAAPQRVPQPPEGIVESDGSTAPATHSQHSTSLSMKNLAATLCVGAYALIPQQEQLHSHPLRYSPLLASVCLAVVAAGVSILWRGAPRYHRRRRRSIEVAVVSSVFSCLLRIILDLLPAGKPLLFVAGVFCVEIGFAAIYVLSPPRHPKSSPV